MSNSKHDFYQSLPKKRMAAGALILDDESKILLVKPTYKSTWEIPGGAVETEESPSKACLREVQEELGINISLERLLCMDWNSTNGEKTESLQFIFLARPLNQQELAMVKLPPNELSEYKFFPVAEALKLLAEPLSKRVSFCITHIHDGATHCLENQALP